MLRKTACLAGLVATTLLLAQACKKDVNPDSYGTEPYALVTPAGLPKMNIPASNPLTKQGVELGRKLFYDPILSANKQMACATCHAQAFGFTDQGKQYSLGIDGIAGTRNAMPLFNLGYQKQFFWDGGAADLETQVLGPITNPVEMHETVANAIAKLNADPTYRSLFKAAFGADSINSNLLMKAIAQFERTMISGNSRYDKYKRGEISLTDQELNGMALFENGNKGDCNHCHSLGSTFSDFEYKNNGLPTLAAIVSRCWGRIAVSSKLRRYAILR